MNKFKNIIPKTFEFIAFLITIYFAKFITDSVEILFKHFINKYNSYDIHDLLINVCIGFTVCLITLLIPLFIELFIKTNFLNKICKIIKENCLFLLLLSSFIGLIFPLWSGIIILISPIIYYFLFKKFLKKNQFIERNFLDYQYVKINFKILCILESPLWIFVLIYTVLCILQEAPFLNYFLLFYMMFSFLCWYIPIYILAKIDYNKNTKNISIKYQHN